MKDIERLTNAGVLLKVNRIKGNYSAYINNKPVINKDSEVATTIYPLQRIIFLGSLFKRDTFERSNIGFFYVSRKQVVVPFRVSDVSDIRHIRLPCYLDFDVLPIGVSYFQDLNIGLHINALKTGVQYFVMEPRFGREAIAALRRNFP